MSEILSLGTEDSSKCIGFVTRGKYKAFQEQRFVLPCGNFADFQLLFCLISRPHLKSEFTCNFALLGVAFERDYRFMLSYIAICFGSPHQVLNSNILT